MVPREHASLVPWERLGDTALSHYGGRSQRIAGLEIRRLNVPATASVVQPILSEGVLSLAGKWRQEDVQAEYFLASIFLPTLPGSDLGTQHYLTTVVARREMPALRYAG